MELRTDKAVLKLAGALLLRHGELSFRDIRAIPFLTNPDEVDSVVQFLIRAFDAETYAKRVSSYPFPQWEQVIRLRKHQ